MVRNTKIYINVLKDDFFTQFDIRNKKSASKKRTLDPSRSVKKAKTTNIFLEIKTKDYKNGQNYTGYFFVSTF